MRRIDEKKEIHFNEHKEEKSGINCNDKYSYFLKNIEVCRKCFLKIHAIHLIILF
jgi:hypothetical protein